MIQFWVLTTSAKYFIPMLRVNVSVKMYPYKLETGSNMNKGLNAHCEKSVAEGFRHHTTHQQESLGPITWTKLKPFTAALLFK
jgi:hypothetical protein